MPRTEEEKLLMTPLKVKFGEKEYAIRPLRALKAQAWRLKLREELEPIVEKLQPTALNHTFFVNGLSAAMMNYPEKVYELLFAYAPYLTRDEILNEETGATEEQIASAFGKIWDMVFADFLAQLGTAHQMLKPVPSPRLASVLN